ncbi:MAG: hypothetical protein QM831_15995 [Kofleriaceae bacterium]
MRWLLVGVSLVVACHDPVPVTHDAPASVLPVDAPADADLDRCGCNGETPVCVYCINGDQEIVDQSCTAPSRVISAGCPPACLAGQVDGDACEIAGVVGHCYVQYTRNHPEIPGVLICGRGR